MTTCPAVATLQEKLYAKAKREPKFKFYSLYGQVLRRDVLQAAWGQVASNKGAPGVDGITISQIVDQPGGPEHLIETIDKKLRERTYRPSAVRRVMIPKANGKLRPLGIPTVKDRVVQTAVKIVLEPIFEAEFLECSHGFRPGRSADEAIEQVRANIAEGRTAIFDADLSSYFDTIPHDKLMLALRRRVTDGSILNLITMWLQAEVEEKDEDGGPPRRLRPKAGTPQGGVISPLLANLYLHWFDKAFHRTDPDDPGPRWWADARLVRYADDFAILAKSISGKLRTWIETTVEGRFGLTINRAKTSVKRIAAHTGESLDFLGCRVGHVPSRYKKGRRYLTTRPSPKAMAAERENLRKIINHRTLWMPIGDMVQRINRQIAGWGNYHQRGTPARCFFLINQFTVERLIRHLRRRSQRPFHLPVGESWWDIATKRLGFKPILVARAKELA